MRIQLAYEHEGHEPDDVIDVDDATGQRLIYEGRARVPDDEAKSESARPSTSDDKAAWQQYVSSLGGEPGEMTKAELQSEADRLESQS
jgi:hypothetical protein